MVVANDSLKLTYSSVALVGQPFTLNAAINSPGNTASPTGTLSLVEGNSTLASVDVSVATPDSNGNYALTVPAGLALGYNSLKVVYTGDANYSSTSTLAGVTGVSSLTTSLLPSYSTSATVGQPYTVSVAINGTVLAGTRALAPSP